VKIPIVWIEGSTYLVGTSKLKFEFKTNCLLVNVGNGYESFTEYIKNNEQSIQSNLVVYMFKSGESLDYVIDCLANDKMLFKKGGGFGARSGVHNTAGRRSSFSASRRSIGPFGEDGGRGRRPTTPMRTTKELRRKMFNQMETSPIGQKRDLSPRLGLGGNSYVKNEVLYDNEYQNTKLDIVANLRAVFKKPLNMEGTYKDSLHAKIGHDENI